MMLRCDGTVSITVSTIAKRVDPFMYVDVCGQTMSEEGVAWTCASFATTDVDQCEKGLRASWPRIRAVL